MSRVLFGMVVLFTAGIAMAQETPPVVESTGEGTVYAPPGYVEFWFHWEKSGVELDVSLKDADALIENWRQRLVAEELHASDFEVVGPAVTALKERTVATSLRLRFSMAGYAQPEAGPRQFSALCAKIMRVAEGLGCLVEGPLLKPNDPDGMVTGAVTAATESAYLPAAAVAGALKSGIYAVDKVEVLGVEWNTPRSASAVEPNLESLSCTAHVKVTYSLSPHG